MVGILIERKYPPYPRESMILISKAKDSNQF